MLLFFTALSSLPFLFAFLFPSNERPRPSRKFRASSRKISAITCRGNIRDGKKRDDNSVVGESLDDVAVEIRTRTKRSEEMRGKKSRKKKEYIYIYICEARDESSISTTYSTVFQNVRRIRGARWERTILQINGSPR